MPRLYAPITHEMLPKVRDRFPALYYEHSRIEVDDSSIKIITASEGVLRLPASTLSTLLLGPGTSISHEAIKVLAQACCMVCWVGSDSMAFYSYGISPVHDMRGAQFQVRHSVDQKKRTEVVRRMYQFRFPDENVKGKTIPQMMGMEGVRVRKCYEESAQRHLVDWRGRRYSVGSFGNDELTNRCLTACNQALYALCNSAILHAGYLPQIGFVHTGGATPFTYDVADLYKTRVSVEAAFGASIEMKGVYDRAVLMRAFLERVLKEKVLEGIVDDIGKVLGRSLNGSADSE